MFPGLWELIIMSYRGMQRNRVRFHGPVFVCGSICVRDFVCVRAHMYFCTGVDLCKKFLQIFYLFKNLVRDYDNECKGWHRTDRNKTVPDTFS